MNDPVVLITMQDVQAYLDGALSLERQRAVEAFLSQNSEALASALEIARQNAELRAVKDELYKDKALTDELERLLGERFRSGQGKT